MAAEQGAPDAAAAPQTAMDVHQQIGALTRQLHDSLNGLGLTAKVKDWAGERRSG
jgi:chemotaxis protein CheZ